MHHPDVSLIFDGELHGYLPSGACPAGSGEPIASNGKSQLRSTFDPLHVGLPFLSLHSLHFVVFSVELCFPPPHNSILLNSTKLSQNTAGGGITHKNPAVHASENAVRTFIGIMGIFMPRALSQHKKFLYPGPPFVVGGQRSLKTPFLTGRPLTGSAGNRIAVNVKLTGAGTFKRGSAPFNSAIRLASYAAITGADIFTPLSNC